MRDIESSVGGVLLSLYRACPMPFTAAAIIDCVSLAPGFLFSPPFRFVAVALHPLSIIGSQSFSLSLQTVLRVAESCSRYIMLPSES